MLELLLSFLSYLFQGPQQDDVQWWFFALGSVCVVVLLACSVVQLFFAVTYVYDKE